MEKITRNNKQLTYWKQQAHVDEHMREIKGNPHNINKYKDISVIISGENTLLVSIMYQVCVTVLMVVSNDTTEADFAIAICNTTKLAGKDGWNSESL